MILFVLGSMRVTKSLGSRAFWSFVPIHASAAPTVKTPDWARTDIDRFVLARLEQAGLTPVRAADKRTLIRRATIDLTGLLPAAEEIDAFEQDTADDAFARVVDRLLASSQYGEAWGRKWLDVARHGEDDPRSLDPPGRGYASYPNAHRYSGRDFRLTDVADTVITDVLK